MAMVLLFRCATGEDWNLIMHDLTMDVDCIANQSEESMKVDGIQGCGAWYSYAYFISFQIIVSMILMNLSIAAVINALTEASNSENKNIKEEYIDGLIQVWA